MSWKVSHYPYNPKFQTDETFENRDDAIEEVHKYQSDDPNDTQCSYIENTETSEWGKRTWGKKNIQWNKRGRPTLTGRKMVQTAIWLPEEMIVWLKSKPETMSETIRDLIKQAMSS